ncbi:hypothetical protein K439DRAFT_1644501 [Ramaria rubella]|nr:hypothetical protein K439DRAFT_1644501 [Ramaria rubella]
MVLTDSFKGNKRGSDASNAQKPNKKARTNHSSAQSLVKSIVASPDGFVLPSSPEDTRDALVDLAQYINSLESELKDVKKANEPVKKTPEELESLAEKIRRAARSGIKNCKTGTAKWVYDGVCPEPDAFAVVLGLETRPTWKVKKIPKDDFETLLGDTIEASVRYDMLFITSKEINVRWNEATGEFKFSGTYGKCQ